MSDDREWVRTFFAAVDRALMRLYADAGAAHPAGATLTVRERALISAVMVALAECPPSPEAP